MQHALLTCRLCDAAGTVKWFDVTKGYGALPAPSPFARLGSLGLWSEGSSCMLCAAGFIAPEDGSSDLFVHQVAPPFPLSAARFARHTVSCPA